MKKGIHPTYFENDIVCGTCGAVWKIGSTRENLRLSICSNCHPFYTGEQRMIVDTEGQVDRFMKRLAASRERQADVSRREKSKTEKTPKKKKSLFEEIYGEEPDTTETPQKKQKNILEEIGSEN